MIRPAGLGIAGRIARAFQASAMTPLLALVLFLSGVLATLVTPREEEPQIDVTMADVFVAFPGPRPRTSTTSSRPRPRRSCRGCPASTTSIRCRVRGWRS